MGINYYGKCTGASGAKYDLWLKVSENSQNVNANTSNVTVKLLLKRNDGYSSSAYNLTESANSVKLTVGTSVRVSKNLSIDTRNNVTVTLAQWTGNISHNEDGALTLPVKGEFTIGSTNLTGGTVSCDFKCTTIPRASLFSLSDLSVNPGGTLKVTINSASKSFTHRLVWSVGNQSASADIGAGVSEYTINVPLEWAEQVTSSPRGILKITLKTYNKGVHIGSSNRNIPFIIPDSSDYKPDFNIILQRINNTVPEEFEEYVKGESQLKVDLQDKSFKYGATLGSVTITVGDVTKRSSPSVFDLTKSGTIKITVTLKDSRGFVTQKSQNINVNDYKSPSVNIKSIERCDEDGTLNNEGEYLIIDYSFVYSSLNDKNTCEGILTFKSSKTSSFDYPVALTSSPFIFGGNIDEGLSYDVAVFVKDKICEDYIEFTRSVPVADIPFNIRRGGKGAAFGKFSERENELEVAWDLNVYGNLKVSGELSYEDLVLETTENSQNLICTARYFPPLQMVWLGLRLETTKELSSNVSYTVAQISGKVPSFFTPLQTIVHFSSGAQGFSGVQNTGEIIFRSDKAIAAGTQIYISGSYIIKR